MGHSAAAWIVTLLLAQPSPASSGAPPTIELDSAPCARPASRPLVCARVFDEGTLIRVRALFRAKGKDHFYWTEMRFDGSRHCAWLPEPSRKTRAIDFYVEAVDNEYEISRTREEQLTIDPSCAAEPGAPGDPVCVGSSTPGQDPMPAGFEADSIDDGC